MNRFIGAVFALAVGCFAAASAAHATVNVSGFGYWDTTAATTAFSAPDASFDFSFDLPNPISTNPTTEAVNFIYHLNGVDVGQTPVNIRFFNNSNSGLFDLNFASLTVSLYGDDVGSSLTLHNGIFGAQAALDQGSPQGFGIVIIGGGAPEPESWALMLVGFGGLGATLRHRRRAVSATA